MILLVTRIDRGISDGVQGLMKVSLVRNFLIQRSTKLNFLPDARYTHGQPRDGDV